MKHDGGLVLHGGGGAGMKWLDNVLSLKVKAPGFADGLDVRYLCVSLQTKMSKE